MNKIKKDLPYNKVYYLAFLAMLVCLYKYLWILALIYLFLIRKREVFKWCLALLILLSFRIIISKQVNHAPPPDTFYGVVNYAKEDKYYISYKGQKVLLYSDNNYKLGDYIYVTGKVIKAKYSKIPLLFDYEKYLNSKGVYYQIIAYNDYYVKHKITIFELRYQLLAFFDKTYNKTISPFYRSLVLGDSSELEIKDDLSIMGISHLFAISGLHIILICSLLKKILKERYINIFLVCYIILTGFLPSVMRAGLIVIFKSFCKKKELEFSSLDVISIVFIVLLIIKPNYIYDTGFYLSFIVSYALLLTPLSEKGSLFKVSLLAQVISLPLIINLNNQINLLTVLFNILLVSFFVQIFLPFTFLSIAIPNFKPYVYMVKGFNSFVKKAADIKEFTLTIGNFSPLNMILYYISLYVFFRYQKVKYLCVVFLLVFFQNSLLLSRNLYVFDVGQGDSTLIETRDEIIMIDCYNDSYKYLIKRGIKKIDYLILTHAHDDHIGDLEEMRKTFKISNIISNPYDKLKGVKYVYKGDIIKTKNLHINVLGPIMADSCNNNSLVLQFVFNKKKYLFMGDAEAKSEQFLLEEYGASLKSDVIKMGHHGSQTSSTEDFISLVDPKLAIISVAERNKYNLPSERVINMLKKRKIKLFLTSKNNTYHDLYYF